LVFLLSGCATIIAGNIGAGATVVTVAETVDQVKTAGDVVAYETTGKTLSDHMLSRLTSKDCRLFNIFDHKNICRVKKTYFYLGGEDGQKRRLAKSGGVSFRYIETSKSTRSPTEEIRRTTKINTSHKLSKVERISKAHRPKAKKPHRGNDKLK
jgi:hypothetical protein